MNATSSLMIENVVSSTVASFAYLGGPVFEFLLTIFLLFFIIGVYFKFVAGGVWKGAGIRRR